jgi:FAD/FMN-containing dehydrogenase
MTRFNTTTVDKRAKTVAIGAGLLWDDVYAALDGTGLNVVGGRVRGVGVAGFVLGGGVWSFSHSTVFWLLMNVFGAKGYSWKTSQLGLTIDTVVSFELVLPDGTVRTVTAQDEDLWFGLRVCLVILLSKLYAEFGLRVASTTLSVDLHDMVASPSLAHTPPPPQGIVTNFVLNAHPQGEVWVAVSFLGCLLRTQLGWKQGRFRHHS